MSTDWSSSSSTHSGRHLRGAERPHALAQLRLVTLRDRRREAHEVARLRIETVLFRHPSYLG